MGAPVTTESIWAEIEQRIFACLAYVTPGGEARSVGVMYVVDQRRLYVATGADAWKARHIRGNGGVGVTIPIERRIPFLPFIRIPAATISLHGRARVLACDAVDAALLRRLLRDKATDPATRAANCVIEVVPAGDFVTYGVGVGLLAMRDKERARGRASTSPSM